MRRTWLLSGALVAALLGVVIAGSPAAAHDGHDPRGTVADAAANHDTPPGDTDDSKDGQDAPDAPQDTKDDGDDGTEDRAGHANRARLKAHLSGLNEVGTDGKTGAGDLDGKGRATVRVRGSEVCWRIRAEGIDDVKMAHIHKAPIGANGGVVVDFKGQFSGCTEVDAALAADIAANPEDYYVNVHTTAFEAGAIRGQLRARPAEEVELKARLLGTNEVDPPGGDPDGRGRFRVELRGTLLCWKFRATGIEPVIAQHIHRGVAGANGPIVVDFDGQSRGCRDIDAELAAEIVADPAGFYGNMHTDSFRAGAIRGQLKAGD